MSPRGTLVPQFDASDQETDRPLGETNGGAVQASAAVYIIDLSPVKAGLVAHPWEFLRPVPASAKAGLKTRAD